MSRKPNQRKEYTAHYNRIEQYAALVDNIYKQATDEFTKLAFSVNHDPIKAFKWSDYPQTKRRVDHLLRGVSDNIQGVVVNGVTAEWEESNFKNDRLARSVIGIKPFDKDDKGRDKIPERFKPYFNNNADALRSFIDRKQKGLNLSQKVWKLSEQYKTDLELALTVGLSDGRSAAELSRDIRTYLKEPAKLFRRVRSENGSLQLSKAAKAYHPGAGTYRSSYKNAMRLTRTEINMAYRTAENVRYQQLDFIIGFEVKRSGRGYDCSVCQSLAGKYPKDFKFTGWHPHCRCYVIPILKTDEEFWAWDGRGEAPTASVNEVKDVPTGYKEWIGKNSDRITQAEKRGTLPCFLRDNKAFVQEKTIKSVRQVKTDNTKNAKNRKYRSPLKPDSLNNYPVPLDETMFDLLEKPSKVTFVRGGEFYFDRYNSVIIDRWDQRWVDSDFFKKQVIAHEFGHVIDFQHFNHANPAVTALMDKYRTAWGDNNKNGFATIDSRIEDLARKLRRIEENTYLRHNTTKADAGECISSSADMLMSLNRNYGKGHTMGYFSDPENQRAEFLAHCFENYYCGNPITKKLMPDLYEDSLKLIDQIIKQIKAKQ